MAFVPSKRQKRLMLAAVVVVGGWLAQQAGIDVSALLGGSVAPPASKARVEAPHVSSPDRRPASASARRGASVDRIERAVAARESGFMVTVDATVVKILRDDNDGSRHQRFLIELAGGRTLLVAHNIDLARRAKLEEGDPVRVRGQYEWNDRGGVLHWTHHDPRGNRAGGWIEANGERVQ